MFKETDQKHIHILFHLIDMYFILSSNLTFLDSLNDKSNYNR